MKIREAYDAGRYCGDVGVVDDQAPERGRQRRNTGDSDGRMYFKVIKFLPRSNEVRYRVGTYGVKVRQLRSTVRPDAIFWTDVGNFCVVAW